MTGTGEILGTTAVLLGAAKSGDESSRNQLAQRFLPRVRRLAYSRVPRGICGLEPEDIVQETLLRAFSRLDNFVPRCDGAFILYLRQVLRTVIVDALRKAGRTLQAAGLDSEPVGDLPSPIARAVGSEVWERYRVAVERLSASQHEAVVLYVECNMDFDEIADATGATSRNAARMVVARGLKRLAELMHVGEPGKE